MPISKGEMHRRFREVGTEKERQEALFRPEVAAELLWRYNTQEARLMARLPLEKYTLLPNGEYQLRLVEDTDYSLAWLYQFYQMLVEWSYEQQYRLSGTLRNKWGFSFRGKVYDLMMQFDVLDDCMWDGGRIIHSKEGVETDITDSLTEDALEIFYLNDKIVTQGNSLPMRDLEEFVIALSWRAILIHAIENILEISDEYTDGN